MDEEGRRILYVTRDLVVPADVAEAGGSDFLDCCVELAAAYDCTFTRNPDGSLVFHKAASTSC